MPYASPDTLSEAGARRWPESWGSHWNIQKNHLQHLLRLLPGPRLRAAVGTGPTVPRSDAKDKPWWAMKTQKAQLLLPMHSLCCSSREDVCPGCPGHAGTSGNPQQMSPPCNALSIPIPLSLRKKKLPISNVNCHSICYVTNL